MSTLVDIGTTESLAAARRGFETLHDTWAGDVLTTLSGHYRHASDPAMREEIAEFARAVERARKEAGPYHRAPSVQPR